MKRIIVLLLALVALAGGAVSCGPAPTPTSLPTEQLATAVAVTQIATAQALRPGEPAPTLPATEAPMHTPTPAVTPPPLSVQAPGWEEVTVHTLCLEVEQSYPEIVGKEPEPIAETAQRILARIGVQVVAEGASCDAILTVTLSGRALGANYLPGGYCYSGAEVEGQMDLTVPGREPFTQPISADYAPQYSISGCPRAAGAPFLLVWPEALVDGLGHLWGPHSLIQALEDEELVVRRSAALALGKMGPAAVDAVPVLIRALGDESWKMRWDAANALGAIGPGAVEAVPALIRALGDEEVYVRMAAAHALRDITGEDFWDAAGWQEWWEEQE